MPYALTLTLDTRAARNLPDNCTPMLHANFFQWLEAIDANLAHLIDSGEGAKPFTVSPLRVEGDLGRFRITLLDDDLFPILMAGLAQRSAVRIHANVLPIAVEPEIVQRTYESLVKQAGRWASVVLRFDTPASFKSNEMHYPLPDPVFVYGSYLTRWNSALQVGERRDEIQGLSAGGQRRADRIPRHPAGAQYRGGAGGVQHSGRLCHLLRHRPQDDAGIGPDAAREGILDC
jgi:CRISPR/Cas system endoribonuclease Cas6 (RAMP superfamily)